MRRTQLALAVFLVVLGVGYLAALAPRRAMLLGLILHSIAALTLAASHLAIHTLDRTLNLHDRASLLSTKATHRVRWVQIAGIILLMLALAADNLPPAIGPLFAIWVALGFNLCAFPAIALSLIAQARLLAEIRPR